MTAEPVGGDDQDSTATVIRLSVPEMDCQSCAGSVENALSALPGIQSTELSPTRGQATVTFRGDEQTRERIVQAVEAAGYDVTSIDDGTQPDAGIDRSPIWLSRRAVTTGIAAVFLLTGLLVAFVDPDWSVRVLQRAYGVDDVLLAGAIVVGGQIILRNGYYSITTRSLDIDFLMSVAIVAATGITLMTDRHLFIEAASLSVLFNVAELLESYSVDRARRSLDELLSLSPDTAVVRRDGEQMDVPVEEVAVGEVVVVQPGEKIPVDGVVEMGASAVDQSPVTGESVPVEKGEGDDVYAGTIAKNGYLEVRATAEAAENTISRVIELVEAANERKTKREQFVDRFARYYTPAVVTAAILTATVPPLLGAPLVEWVVRAIAFLVIACPCAFVISTPVTVVSGITSAARNGVLLKGGDHLEAMGEVDAVAFDKTGTLTTGELDVTDVVPLNGNTETDVLRCARGLESRSEHPIARAIVGRAEAEAVEERTITDFESLAGEGVQAVLDGRQHYAGKPELFQELGFDLSHVHFTDATGEISTEAARKCQREDCLDLVENTIPQLQSEGKTVVLVGTETEIEGVIAVADTIRPRAKETIEALADQGIATAMITGDNERAAASVADQLGIDTYRAGLLPEDKVDAVRELEAEYGSIAMVGDGINDAPALATATVGIAMGAAGSDTAIETADVALLADDLDRIPYLTALSRRAVNVIKQNIWGSLGVKALLAVGIPFGIVGVVHAVIIGDVGMTTAITGNAMRLARIGPDSGE